MSKSITHIPDQLKGIKGWLVWKYVHVDGEKKPRKMPIYVSGGRRVGVQGTQQDRAKLATFEDAVARVQRGGVEGLGLALLPDWNLVALDFDDCVVDGEVVGEVSALVMDTYAELSPSGKGVRAYMTGVCPDRKSRSTEGVFGFETFHAKGFVTVTGNPLPVFDLVGVPDKLAPFEGSKAAGLFTQRFGQKPSEVSTNSTSGVVVDVVGLKESEIREMLDKLDPDLGYADWLKVGMAIHHETNGAGFHLWDEWSAGGGKYPGYNSLERKWASFKRTEGQVITASWLMQFAGMDNAPAVWANDFSVLDSTKAAPPFKDGRFVPQNLATFLSKPTQSWMVKPMSASEFITKLFGDLPGLFKDEDELRHLWGQPDTRRSLLESLAEKGYC